MTLQPKDLVIGGIAVAALSLAAAAYIRRNAELKDLRVIADHLITIKTELQFPDIVAHYNDPPTPDEGEK